MLPRVALSVACLGVFLRDFHASGCGGPGHERAPGIKAATDTDCADKPVFRPSALVVRHGDPASATCSVCQSACWNTTFDLERSAGEVTKNDTSILWTIDRLTEWGIHVTCFYTVVHNDSDKQCCNTLSINVYKPPDAVSISVYNHTGPMSEGHRYSLLCTVHDVAPLNNLAVTFYRGKTPLGQPQSYADTQTMPQTPIFTHVIIPSEEDDGAQYWCEAELQLGPEGPQRPPVVASQNINATVYYAPRLAASRHFNKLTVTEGDSLRLNCSAVGNPAPSYTWTLPPSFHSHRVGGLLTVESAGYEHGGTFTCSAGNAAGSVEASFTVDVRANRVPYIIAAAIIGGVLIVSGVLVGYSYYCKRKRGQYNVQLTLLSRS